MNSSVLGRLDRLRKLLRFAMIYGPTRTFFKVAGRLRFRPPTVGRRRSADIGLIGCGQFAFATIGYFLHRSFGHRVLGCHDIDDSAAHSLARGLRVARVCASVDDLIAMPELRLVYIASNHASHADYAARALDRGLDVYVEKPIAVDHSQLIRLLSARQRAQGRLFAGYNRPFSPAIRGLRSRTTIDPAGGITLHCFVVGHQLGRDHWYRRPEEGTRVCGNIGHWLDLFVHILAWRSLPDLLEIGVTWADDTEPDDNVSISIRSDRSDLFSVLLTSRCEPFEGISETIHFQHGDTIAKIDDFRRMTLWQGPDLYRRRWWPKDVGHQGAILQPFTPGTGRDWHEIELSTLLMLHIAEMVSRRQRRSDFSFAEQWARIETALAQGPASTPLYESA